MWNGRWSRELASLYEQYYDLFGIEPDCHLENTAGANFDAISYEEFKNKLVLSIKEKQEIQ